MNVAGTAQGDSMGRNIVIKIFVTIILSMAFVGCGQKSAKVKLSVTQSFAFGGSNMAAVSGGGLMVWGRNSANGESFGRSLDTSDSINLDLKNGTWTFYAMAWEGSNWDSVAGNDNLGGRVRCASAQGITLAGQGAVVDLTLNNSTCADSAFVGGAAVGSGSAPNFNLPKMFPKFCSDIASITGIANDCDDDPALASRVSFKAPVSSYRIKLPSFDATNSTNVTYLSTGVSSPCIPFTSLTATSGKSDLGIPGLPGGSFYTPFRVKIEQYFSPDCDATAGTARGVVNTVLVGGASVSSTQSITHAFDPNSNVTSIRLTDSAVCSPFGTNRTGDFSSTTHPFAGGSGFANDPYIICSVPQFHAMNTYSSNALIYLTAHFKLGRDLDFNSYSKGLTTATLPSNFSCLKDGTNFIPIGSGNMVCSAGVPNWSNGTGLGSFVASFWGQNHTLSNLRFSDKTITKAGLFTHLNASAAEKIAYLNFVSPEIEGAHTVGVLAGESNTTGINKITLKNIHVESRGYTGTFAYTGGLTGKITGSAVKDVTLFSGQVSGEYSRVGGITGYSSSGNFQRVAANVDVKTYNKSGVEEIGGFVGHADGSTFAQVKYEGSIETSAVKVGGLIGYANGGSNTLTDFYTIAFIENHNTVPSPLDLYTGGVFGSGGSLNMSNGYTLSVIKVPSGANSNYLTVGGSGTITSPSNLYSLSLAEHSPTNTITSGGMTAGTFGSFYDSSLTLSPNWTFLSGELPRLTFENHPCVQSGVSGSGAGTVSSPKIICNPSQFASMQSGGTNFFELKSNIRLSNANTSHNVLSSLSARLDGKGFTIIGGGTDGTTGSNALSGYIGTISATGELKNLKISGMYLKRPTPSGSVTTASGLVAGQNSGNLENITVRGADVSTKDYTGGLVGINSGTITEVRFGGRVAGKDYIAGLAAKNTGTIKESSFDGEIVCDDISDCAEHAGLVHSNETTGVLSVSEMRGRILQQSPSYLSNFAAFVASDNFGIIRDVNVTPEAEMVITGSDPKFIAQNNTGTLTRVLSQGKVVFDDDIQTTSFPAGWPSTSGITGNNFRMGSSGKRLINSKPFTCTDSVSNQDQLTVSDWASYTNRTGWESHFLGANFGGYAYNHASAPAADKRLFAEIEIQGTGGTRRYHLPIVLIDTTNYIFSVAGYICDTAASPAGTVSFYWSTVLPVVFNPSETITAGYLLPQKLNYDQPSTRKNILGGTWAGLTVDETHDQTWLKDSYKYLIGLAGLPTGGLPTWELEDEGQMGIFKLHD